MTQELVESVTTYLRSLDGAQSSLGDLLERKRAALVKADTGAMQNLLAEEVALTQRFAKMMTGRREILARARPLGFTADSIESLVGQLETAGVDSQALAKTVAEQKSVAEANRRENWVHWIIAQRTYSHYNEVLNIVAQQGQKSPDYTENNEIRPAGGAFLDASI